MVVIPYSSDTLEHLHFGRERKLALAFPRSYYDGFIILGNGQESMSGQTLSTGDRTKVDYLLVVEPKHLIEKKKQNLKQKERKMRVSVFQSLELDPEQVDVTPVVNPPKDPYDKARVQLMFRDANYTSLLIDTKALLHYLESLTEQVRLIDLKQDPKDL